MYEALVLTGAGSVAGVALGWAVIANFKKMIVKLLADAPFLWPSLQFIVLTGLACIALMVISGALCALYPAIKTSLREPYEAIRGEE